MWAGAHEMWSSGGYVDITWVSHCPDTKEPVKHPPAEFPDLAQPMEVPVMSQLSAFEVPHSLLTAHKRVLVGPMSPQPLRLTAPSPTFLKLCSSVYEPHLATPACWLLYPFATWTLRSPDFSDPFCWGHSLTHLRSPLYIGSHYPKEIEFSSCLPENKDYVPHLWHSHLSAQSVGDI